MVGGAPVAQSADVYTGLAVLGDISSSGGDFRRFVLNEFYQRRSLFLLPEHLTQQLHGAGESVVKYALGAGLQGNDRDTQLLLKGILLLHILKLGNDDIGAAGKDFFRFRGLGHGAAHTAGGQGAEHIAVSQHIGTGNGVKHLGTLLQRGIIDVLHAAQQVHVTDVAVHSQCARADADHFLITSGGNSDFPADHVGNGDLRAFRRSGSGLRGGSGYGRFGGFGFRCFFTAAGCQRQQHHTGKQQRQDFLSLHCGILLKSLFHVLSRQF